MTEAEIFVQQALSHMRVASACLHTALEDEDTDTGDLFATDEIYETVGELRKTLQSTIRELTALLNL